MFTDIQDSTALWERLGDGFRPVLDRHNQLIRALIQQWTGYEVKSQGDSFMAAFERGTDAVHCALEIQWALAGQDWPPEVGDLRVRIGIHTGEPLVGHDAAGRVDYFGPVVNRADRIMAAGHGGQILISSATRDIVEGALAGNPVLLDLDRHRLRGLAQVERLFEVRHPELSSQRFPPLRTLDLRRTNLPTQLSTFIGRKQELADLRELLCRPETRLLTLTGPGGSGKTRAAFEVASECAGSFADGVWLVNLADIHEPDNLLPQIAAAVQLALLPDRDPREQLVAHLSERELLLVLDGFERVIGASLLLADILKSALHVKCLVTSQIALRLRGEQEYAMPPLQLPDARGAAPEALLQFDSVMLFMERARAVRADFALTASNAPLIAEICRKLEGVALAIELAAAQVVDMSLVEVQQGLRSRLDLLSSESPDLPERHRTLRAAIDWSYSLLDAPGQRALQQLSVFAGGCLRESAQAVCGPQGLAALRNLHRHSLLSTTETTLGRTRYSLLDMVREYARAKLEEQPDVAHEVRDQHARHYLEFAELRAGQMRTPDEARALDELGAELDNLRMAIDWAQQSRESELCARLALALYEPLRQRGFWEEARWHLQAGRTAIEGSGGAAQRLLAAIRHHLASLAQDMGELTEARRHAEAGLALQRELNHPPGIADTQNLLGLIARDEGETDVAQQCFEESLRLLPEQDHARRGMVLNNLALLASRRGQRDEARRLYQESLTHQRTAGDRRTEATTLGNLGVLAHDAGDHAEARHLYLESLALRRALGDRDGIGVMLNNLGELAELAGDGETALALFVHAERIFRDLHSAHVIHPAQSLERLAEALGPERWGELRAAAEQTRWEEVVERGR